MRGSRTHARRRTRWPGLATTAARWTRTAGGAPGRGRGGPGAAAGQVEVDEGDDVVRAIGRRDGAADDRLRSDEALLLAGEGGEDDRVAEQLAPRREDARDLDRDRRSRCVVVRRGEDRA